MVKKSLGNAVALCVFLLVSVAAHAEDYVITLKDNQFSPRELVVPTGRKIKITVKNLDTTPAEFESSDLNREKLVGANSEIFVYIGPLESGSYKIFDDFHHSTTSGVITAK